MILRIASLLKIGVPVNGKEGLLSSSGDTVPTDGESGFATGCYFAHTDGGNGTAAYINEGTYASCDFNAITVGA